MGMKHCGEPAAFVVGDLAGNESFACVFHADPAAAETTWIVRTEIGDWYRARAMAIPDPLPTCKEAKVEPAA